MTAKEVAGFFTAGKLNQQTEHPTSSQSFPRILPNTHTRAVHVRAREAREDLHVSARGAHGDGVGVEAEDPSRDGQRREARRCSHRQTTTSHGSYFRDHPRGAGERVGVTSAPKPPPSAFVLTEALSRPHSENRRTACKSTTRLAWSTVVPSRRQSREPEIARWMDDDQKKHQFLINKQWPKSSPHLSWSLSLCLSVSLPSTFCFAP